MNKHFVAVNYIACSAEYRPRFEELFTSRAHAIDKMPGFINMHVLRPLKENDNYLIVSYWENETSFKEWMKSDAFAKGHRRGFEDLAKAKAEGKPVPMSSDFKTYQVISD